MANNLLTFPPICHCSLIRVVLALVPSGCALLAWIITTTMTFDDLPSTEKNLTLPSTLPEDPLSSLQTPLLPSPTVVEAQDHSHASIRLRGGNSSAPCSIRASRKSANNHGITDLEAPAAAEEDLDYAEIESAEPAVFAHNEEQSLWQMLGHAMVGRWGSIRPLRLLQ